MMRLIKNLLLLLSVFYFCCNAFSQTADNKKIIIIRHGEKADEGGNLSCRGLNRALGLSAVLYAKYKLPNHIFVPAIKNGKSTNQSRMYQTIVPFAVKYNLNIDTRYNVEEPKALADAIMKIPGYVLVVWEHNQIPNIAHALGIKEKNLKWKDSDFDSIWIITFKSGSSVLTVDNENLHPATTCK